MTISLQKAKVLSGMFSSKTWKYNVCSINLEAKVLPLYAIRVQSVLLFLVNKYAAQNF